MGGSSSAQQPVVQSTTKDPWAPSQPHLEAAMTGAQNLFTGDIGYQPFSGQMQANQSPYTTAGFNWTHDLSQQQAYGSPAWNAANNLTMQQLQSGGLGAGQQTGLALMGQNRGDLRNLGLYQAQMAPRYQQVHNQFQDIYNQAQGTQNPFLDQILASNNQRIGDRINASMSGAGRYGSGAHTDVMARSLAEANAPVLAQDYEARQQRKLAAQQGLLQADQGELGMYGQLGQTLLGQQGINRDINDVYSAGLNRAGTFAQLVPGMDAARYQGADRMMGLGEYMGGREQQDIANQMAVYNAQQARPWEQLARYNAIAAQTGGLGGTQVRTTQGPQIPTTQRILGGGLAGAGLGSMFMPGIGTAIGGLGGGLLGAFGLE